MRDFDGIEILLVDRDESFAAFASRVIAKSNAGNKLFWAKDSTEALDFIACAGAFERRDPRELPRLVLLDIEMPRPAGFSVLQKLKGDKRTQPVPVVVMTASNQGGDVDECYRLGVNAYIIKPSGFTELTEVIASVSRFWLLVNQVPQ
jgi:two-component system response regulator